MKQVIAIIAAGETEEIAGQNVREFAGVPLVAHSIARAKGAKRVSRVVVCTDGRAIAEVANKHGAEVIESPGFVFGDDDPNTVLSHALTTLREREGYSPDVVVILSSMHPIGESADIDGAIEQLEADMADSLVSVCDAGQACWIREGQRGRQERAKDARYRENGSMYIVQGIGFVKHRSRTFGRVALFEVEWAKGLRIEREEDWGVCEAVYRAKLGARLGARLEAAGGHSANPPARSVREGSGPGRGCEADLCAIRLLVFDFDGVMSDNRVLVMQDGTEGTLCNRSDGLGIGNLREASERGGWGLAMMVLSKEANPVVGARCKKLKLECRQGIDDKLAELTRIIGERGLTLDQVAYVGNDINDLPCMSKVGLPIAVADAYPPVLEAAKMVTVRAGGCGAVREVCDWILAARRSS